MNECGRSSRCLYGTGTPFFFVDFCYSVYNQCESFIYLDLIVKNSEIIIERYFKWWISIKLVVSCTKIINLLII
jgi:hypothetical protein